MSVVFLGLKATNMLILSRLIVRTELILYL